MRILRYALPMVLCWVSVAPAQVSILRRSVTASGESSVSVNPDVAQVTVSVETRSRTAQEASNENATHTANVLTQLRQLLTGAAEIKTLGYTLTPNYVYPKDGGTPTITGYTAVNTVQVRQGNLTLVGRIIDTAIQAGANRIQGIVFTLKDPSSAQAQALRQAAAAAKSQAEAIANGLGLRTGQVITAQQGGSIRPVTTDTRLGATAAAPTTPVEPGAVVVSANVTVEVELL